MSVSLETTIGARVERNAGGLRDLVVLALPVVLTNLSATLMMTTDAIMVGRLGAAALGAVGYGGIWYWTVLSVFSGTATGVQTFVSQAHGAGAPRQCGPWAWQAFYALVPVAALGMTLFAVAFADLSTWLAPAPELRPLAVQFVHARAFGVLGFGTAWVLAGFFRGIGDTRTPLYAMIAANLVNLVFNYGLIYGHLGLPAWGVFGAGTATAIAEWVYAALLFAAFRRRRVHAAYATAPRGPDLAAIWRFLRTSLPIGGQWMLDMLAFATFTSVVARMGAIEMAASQALLSLMQLSFMQVIGISIALSTLVGRYVGAGDLPAAERSHATGLRLGLTVSAAVSVIFLAAPQLCLRLFTNDDAVLDLGAPLIAVGVAFQLCDAVGVLTGGTLRGAGDTRWPFVVQAALAWGLFLPAAYLGGTTFGGGLTGAWLGGVVYVAVLGTAFLWRFHGGAWKRLRI